MPDYRWCRVPGGTCFFTVNLLEWKLDMLRTVVRSVLGMLHAEHIAPSSISMN